LTQSPYARTSKTGDVVLTFEFGHAPDEKNRFEVRFEALAYRYRGWGHVTEWHVRAFGKIVEVKDSPWLEELESISVPRGFHYGELHHYMIYVDSHAKEGCYEFIASSWHMSGIERPE